MSLCVHVWTLNVEAPSHESRCHWTTAISLTKTMPVVANLAPPKHKINRKSGRCHIVTSDTRYGKHQASASSMVMYSTGILRGKGALTSQIWHRIGGYPRPVPLKSDPPSPCPKYLPSSFNSSVSIIIYQWFSSRSWWPCGYFPCCGLYLQC